VVREADTGAFHDLAFAPQESEGDNANFSSLPLAMPPMSSRPSPAAYPDSGGNGGMARFSAALDGIFSRGDKKETRESAPATPKAVKAKTNVEMASVLARS